MLLTHLAFATDPRWAVVWLVRWLGALLSCFFFLLWVVVVMVIVVADGGGHCGWLLRIVVDVFIIVLMSYLCYFNQIAKNINH